MTCQTVNCQHCYFSEDIIISWHVLKLNAQWKLRLQLNVLNQKCTLKITWSNWEFNPFHKINHFVSRWRMNNNNLNKTKRKLVSQRAHRRDALISPPVRRVKDRSPCMRSSVCETITAESERFQQPAAFTGLLALSFNK